MPPPERGAVERILHYPEESPAGDADRVHRGAAVVDVGDASTTCARPSICGGFFESMWWTRAKAARGDRSRPVLRARAGPLADLVDPTAAGPRHRRPGGGARMFERYNLVARRWWTMQRLVGV